MVARRWLTPDGDYELSAGRPRADETMASAVLLRLRMHRGSCPVMPTLGSRIHTIDKLTKTTARLAESYAKEALEDLVKRGDIRALEVTGAVDGGRLDLVVAWRDRGGRRRSVEFTRKVG